MSTDDDAGGTAGSKVDRSTQTADHGAPVRIHKFMPDLHALMMETGSPAIALCGFVMRPRNRVSAAVAAKAVVCAPCETLSLELQFCWSPDEAAP